MGEFLRSLLSATLLLLGRALRSRGLVEAALKTDDQNLRAARWLAKKGDSGPLSAIMAGNLSRALDSKAERMRAQLAVIRHTTGALNDKTIPPVLKDVGNARAQLFQDLFVIELLAGKRGGFFVEVGVGEGEFLSNSYLLEHDYGWSGLLVEPNPDFHAAIRDRRSATLDPRAVLDHSGERVTFICDDEMGELSTIEAYKESDHRSRSGREVTVETVTLTDLLDQHDAPRDIDYISIDTEGSEIEVLESLDMARYSVGIFTIEHNFVAPRFRRIREIMAAKGYVQVFAELSEFDAWFVRRDLLEGLEEVG